MHKTILLLVALSLATASCESDYDDLYVDQCLRTRLFQECLDKVPRGPESTTYNDWSEVVAECSSEGYYAARRYKKHIKPECLAP